MPALYDQPGICFDYPENWDIEESEPVAKGVSQVEYQQVAVQSPGGAFWTVSRYAGGRDVTEQVKAVVSAMRENYPNMDVEPIEETIGGHEVGGFELTFFYLDLISTAQVRGVVTRDDAWVIFCQAEDREFVQLGEVFRAITTSLLRRLQKAPL
ncbi:MAG: hypothetical protein HYS13_02155 [Planctomycetia bacterium]|nr:hypothetical protein [Planctomycetia bacterium]